MRFYPLADLGRDDIPTFVTAPQCAWLYKFITYLLTYLKVGTEFCDQKMQG